MNIRFVWRVFPRMLFSNFSECCILRKSRALFVAITNNSFRTTIGCPEILSFSQWTLVLELADGYCMDSLRKHATEQMQSVRDCDPVDKVVVAARRFNIIEWLLLSFDEILRRQIFETARCGFTRSRNCIALGIHPRAHGLSAV